MAIYVIEIEELTYVFLFENQAGHHFVGTLLQGRRIRVRESGEFPDESRKKSMLRGRDRLRGPWRG